VLVFSRRKGQSVRIGAVTVIVSATHRSSVKLAIDAPPGTSVLRGELVALRGDAERPSEQTEPDGGERRPFDEVQPLDRPQPPAAPKRRRRAPER
jgi:carbon storage regulator CsrA